MLTYTTYYKVLKLIYKSTIFDLQWVLNHKYNMVQSGHLSFTGLYREEEHRNVTEIQLPSESIIL